MTQGAIVSPCIGKTLWQTELGGHHLSVTKDIVKFWDSDDPRALVNLLPDPIVRAVENARYARPTLFTMDEFTLYTTLGSEKCRPTPSDNRLRLKFWDEYDRAQATGTKINISNVVRGVVMPEYFTQTFLDRPEKIAWLMCPPASYIVKMEEALAFGIEQLRDILQLPHVNPTTSKVDTKLAELKAKIVAMMDLRVKGAIPQKIEQRNMNLNVNMKEETVMSHMVERSQAEIDEKIRELEKRDMRRAKKALEEAKDVIVVDPE